MNTVRTIRHTVLVALVALALGVLISGCASPQQDGDDNAAAGESASRQSGEDTATEEIVPQQGGDGNTAAGEQYEETDTAAEDQYEETVPDQEGSPAQDQYEETVPDQEASSEGTSPQQSAPEETSPEEGSRQGDDQSTPAEEQYEEAVPEPTPPEDGFDEPQLPLPGNGEVRRFTQERATAPFEIKSSGGTNYLVKLEDANSGLDVLDVFVRGGSIVEVSVPLGTYVVKYAAGKNWYGYEHYFRPNTAYSKADTTFRFRVDGNQFRGYTITLYPVVGGNLSTSSIRANEF